MRNAKIINGDVQRQPLRQIVPHPDYVRNVDSCSSLLRLHQNAYSYHGDHMQLDLLQKHRGTKPGIRDVKLATLSSSSSVSKAKYNDLMSTCSDKHNLITEQYHIFYRNLNYNAAIADAGND